MKTPKVSAIIPAYNEAGNIGATITALKGLNWLDEIIVVDDGSKDETGKIAEEAEVIVFRLAENRGKGMAMEVGAAASRGDVLLFLDGDLRETAANAWPLAEPILQGRANMAVALLPLSGKGGFGIVQGLSRWAVARAGGGLLAQPLSGQRAMAREVWQKFGSFRGGFGVETALGMGVARLGFSLLEVPVDMSHDRTGKTIKGLAHRGQQLIHVVLAILRNWRLLLPEKGGVDG